MTARAGVSPSPRRAPNNLRLRVVSGTVLALAAVALTWLGGTPFALFSAAIGAAVFYEWAAITRPASHIGHQAFSAVLLACLLAAMIASLLSWPMLLAAALVCLVFGLAFGRWRWTFLGFLYALAAGLPLAWLRGDNGAGLASVVFLFAVVWATDIFAYFVGRALGGPKLAPAISPGKTWSGAVGGTMAGVVAGLAASWSMGLPVTVALALVALVLSAASQIGDLFESWIKRRFGVKDSGALIPGHGGVMDRVDGLVAAALTLYLISATSQPVTGEVLPF